MGQKKLFKYEFRGLIHPLLVKFNWGPVVSPFSFPELGMTGKVGFEVHDGEVLAHLESPQDPKEFNLIFMGCLGEIVKLGIYPYLDAFGYANGLAFSVELTQAKEANSGDWKWLPVQVPVLRERTKSPDDKFREICDLYDSPKAWYLQKALSDLRSAIASASDTGLFCYRAVETLASFFKETPHEKLTNDTWELFRKSIHASRDEINVIKRYADISRHGSVTRIPTEKRAEVFAATGNIIDKFVMLAKRGYDGRASPIEKLGPKTGTD